MLLNGTDDVPIFELASFAFICFTLIVSEEIVGAEMLVVAEIVGAEMLVAAEIVGAEMLVAAEIVVPVMLLKPLIADVPGVVPAIF
jgi:hypothetical protein